jgi:DNA (cytosine-5)-methyltransferase 1
VVGALSARGYTKYTDQEFVRGGQLVTDRDLREREREVPVGVNPSNPDIAGTLPSNAQGGQRTTDIAGAFVCGFSHTQGLDPQATEERTPTLRKNGGGMAAGVGSTVRRLTPLECERLMGWPDGWTDIPWNKKDHAPDSRRYAACGNGVVAPVAYWIAARLAEVLK